MLVTDAAKHWHHHCQSSGVDWTCVSSRNHILVFLFDISIDTISGPCSDASYLGCLKYHWTELSSIEHLHWVVEICPRCHTSRWVDLMLCAGWHAAARVQTEAVQHPGPDDAVSIERCRQTVGTSRYGPLLSCTQQLSGTGIEGLTASCDCTCFCGSGCYWGDCP